MGSNTSKEEKQPLLDCSQNIPIVSEELKLVLIGIKGAGKNIIGNAILNEKFFTFWTSYKRGYIMATREVSGTQIHLARIPGWTGELENAENTKKEIVYCVQSLYRSGPHAVLLVIKVNSLLSHSTISTLESLLTTQLWDHTIVIFTSGEKLRNCSIEDYIRREKLQPLINKCGQRYFVIKKNDSNQIIETIDMHIAPKKSTSCFKLSSEAEENNITLLKNLGCLVERIKSKNASILDFKEKFKNAQNDDSIQKLLRSKDAEIRRLQTILEDKEKEIKLLQSRAHNPVMFAANRGNNALEDQDKTLKDDLEIEKTENITPNKAVKKKDAEIHELTKLSKPGSTNELSTHDDQRTTLVHAGYCRKLKMSRCQDDSVMSRGQIPLKELSSRGSALNNWSSTLLRILDMLSDGELKKMIYLMIWNDKYEICRSSVEHKDRIDLADQMLKRWGEEKSVLITLDLLKKIPRNDDAMKEQMQPFLKGEAW